MAYVQRTRSYAKPAYSTANAAPKLRTIRAWSDMQQSIFKDIESGSGNTHVSALAGTGKTATIVEGFYHLPANNSTLMCAFNKKIQVELESRAPNNIEIKTMHALGYAACRRAFPKIGRPDDKGDKLNGFIRAERGDDSDTYELRASLAKAVSLCKGYLADNHEMIDPILDRHEIDTCGDKREEFIGSIINVLAACKKDTSRIDFDDMIWMPNVHNLKLNQYNRVMIDEAQDLNIAQINLALNSCSSNGRILSVADIFQAIYSFRGADSSAVQNIIERCKSKVLPLSVTYRCAKSIVKVANKYVPELQASDNAEEGSVNDIGASQLEGLVRPGDFILSRVNAPLIKWCLALLKARIPANIQGRDMGAQLSSLIKKSKKKDVNSFLDWLHEYEGMEVDRLIKARREPDVLQDKMECLRVLCEGTNSLDDVKANLDKLFKDGDDKDRVILSSIHKSKGLERDRVFLLTKTCKPGKNQEENNLVYVAVTRARKELFMVA